MDRNKPNPLYTAGEIAELAGVSWSRCEYVLRTRAIEPAMRAGTMRLYSAEAAEKVREEAQAIAERRRPRELAGR